jgi:hypothetical protein
MTDTVKIPRPKFVRKGKATGRIEHDSRGNAVFKRTRATDSDEIHHPSSLELVDDSGKSQGHSRPRAKTPKAKS